MDNLGDPTVHTSSVLRPFGVFAVISPFNFPMALAAGPSSGALMAGNTVVFKPATASAMSGVLLAEAYRDAGLPDGVFNLVMGPGDTVGQEIQENPGIDGIVFTGSYEIQKCSANSRVYVARPVPDELVKLLVQKTEAIEIGDPLRRLVWLGPVIDEAAVERCLAAAADARRDGRVFVGGERLTDAGMDRGFYVEPTVVGGLPADHRLFQDELFVPSPPSTPWTRSMRLCASPTTARTGSRPASAARTRPRSAASSTRSRRASST
jgi:1-pyrroline-5-carboxylate dehydrogenase